MKSNDDDKVSTRITAPPVPLPAVPDVIADGLNGYVVHTQGEAIARAEELLANDEKRLALAEAARATARKFRSDKAADELIGLYRELRSARRTPTASTM